MDNRVKALKMGANDYMSKPFNAQELIARIENLIILKNSMDQALATETAFLQAQIKPHFLFNTLNTISSFCDTDPEKASSLIDDFARYLRQSFDFKSTELSVPLEREMQLVQSFVEIQKARFGDRIYFEVSNSSASHFSLPPLCIQPLIENSILHGLKKKEKVSVTLKVSENSDGICITVKDDGPGIPKEKMEGILLRSENKGIGLWNIDTRLKKFFGTGLNIISDEKNGTEISFGISKEYMHETCHHC
jgi:sensor histidine kinase YesM